MKNDFARNLTKTYLVIIAISIATCAYAVPTHHWNTANWAAAFTIMFTIFTTTIWIIDRIAG